MEAKEVLLTIFMISILLTAGLFIGNIINNLVNGDREELSPIEESIILSAIILCIELAIITAGRKKKEVDIQEYVKEARKETY